MVGIETQQRENVTLSLPQDVLRAARHKAVDRGVSLSRFLATILEEHIVADREYEEAMQRALQRMREGFDLGTNGRATWTRDELHER